MSRIIRFLRRDRGSAVLEFALVAPIFFTLVLGIMMFSRAYQRLNSLNSALREGARIAAVQPNPTASRNVITAQMWQFSRGFGFTIDTARVQITPATFTATTTTVTVGVTAYPLFAGLNFLGGLQSITVTRSAVFRWEYGP